SLRAVRFGSWELAIGSCPSDSLRAENDAVTRSARITLGLMVSVASMDSGRRPLRSHQPKPPPTFDREYTLEATTLGYRGVGGEIDGVRNPTLWARTGENVPLTMVNGERMGPEMGPENFNIR